MRYFNSNNIKHYWKYFFIDGVAASHFCPQGLRHFIYRCCGHKIEGGIYAECFFGYGPKGTLRVGKGSYCNYRCFFDLGDDISIGKNCSIAFGVTFCNSYHEIGDAKQRAGRGKIGKITVGDGCWIGANVTILPGVNIGNGCVVGAGSLVTKDCDPNGIYVGVPAKRIKEL